MSLYDLAYWQKKSNNITILNQAFINGKFVETKNKITVINPSNGQTLSEVSACNVDEINLAVDAARQSFESKSWAGRHPRERKSVLLKLASLIMKNIEELALLETMSMGKPITEAMNYDLPETIRCFAWYAEAIDKLYNEIAPTGDDALATITREPVGVVGAIVPWNFPLMIAAWKIAPALAAGNSIILKPSEQTPFSALKLAELVQQAGIPPGVFNVVPGTGLEAGRILSLHPDVDCITFTGSTSTGKKIMEYSGQSNLKRVWLECGGKSPHIIFEDCPNLDVAAQAVVTGILSNQGEVCIAGSRLFIHDSIYDEFLDKVCSMIAKISPGDPLDPKTTLGAIVNENQYKKILDYIESGKKQGASLKVGGNTIKLELGGYFISPTIFECSNQKLTICQDEIFGPVLSVQRFFNEDEVIKLANDSMYGLGAGLWTSKLARAHRVSKKLRSGLVWVNCYFDGDITVPFGGVKQSGFGRDKSLHAFDKYSDLKTTWFNLKF